MQSLESTLVLAVTFMSILGKVCIGQDVPGAYPTIGSLAAFRPVESSSVCGEGGSDDYCLYTPDSVASLLPNCMQVQCNNTCPFSSSSPSPIDLASLSSSFGPGVSATQGRPGSTSSALRFQNSSISIPAASVPAISNNGFSFAAWIKQDEDNHGALISKGDGTSIIYTLSVSSSNITLSYLLNSRMRMATSNGLLLNPNYWHHLAVTIYDEDLAFYVNGTVVSVERLEGIIVDNPNRDIKLGQIDTTSSSYNGLIQDIHYYNQALTAREVLESATGSLPFLHLSSECHCPPSHPLINPRNPSVCTQHPGSLIFRGNMARLNSLSHTVGYVNDFSRLIEWISSPGIRNVNITMNLTNSLYEIFLVTIQYSAPRPRAAVLETSSDGGVTFRPIQYYANDCMLYFGLPDNGPILTADDVNCITTESSQIPTSNGNVRFRSINQGTRNFDLNSSPEFRNFILASHLRLRLVDYFTDSTSLRHQYYSIQEIAVAARCACNGHASRCGNDINAVCQCEHNTTGNNCQYCLSTHNDKPWRYGTTTNGYPCKPCRCNGHATTCIYNKTVDPFPDTYELGGGGVCQNCQDNTAGVNCETCQFGFFRPSTSDAEPCEPCRCDPNGITDQGDCIKDEGRGGQILGQCACKANVIGLKCDVCRPGYSNLTANNPDGCSPCNCNTSGTFNGVDTCDSNTGQCLCKANVIGLKCDVCQVGTTSLNASNPFGCEGCTCDPIGATSTNCDPITAMCTCKTGVTGPRCDQCLPGFKDLSNNGCVNCSCTPDGSVSNNCDPVSGQCPCMSNVMGISCDVCMPGFYDITSGCPNCGCVVAGTINGTTSCDSVSGQCTCKSNVQGRTCNTCNSGFTGLLESDPNGCSACNCFHPNTDLTGTVCNPLTGQCNCKPSAAGVRCDMCQDGFYMTASGCVPCSCNPNGSNSSVCDQTTGNCICKTVGITGRVCDTCSPGFYQFPSCFSCGCDEAGAVEDTLCNQTTGVCSCKQFVTGAICDECLQGYQNLEASNPFGCSALPDELAPPTITSQSSTSILLTWLPPEVPNGFIQGYVVFQNNSQIATISQLNYTIEGLQPNTIYSFFLEAFNSAGSTRSVAVTGRTQEGIPTGIDPPMLRAIDAFSINASWIAPAVQNGIINRYELAIVTFESDHENTVFRGQNMMTIIQNLSPFTSYYFIVRACTSGGCGSSNSSFIRTLQAPPTFQMRPNVTTLTATSLLIQWVEPKEPNGIVGFYEIRQREAPFQGDGVSIGNTTSQLFMATGLQPFTIYEFSVIAYTDGGGTSSEWANGMTAGAVPNFVQPPMLQALSSSQIQVSWSEPQMPNGIIISYNIIQIISEDGIELQVFSSPIIGSQIIDNLLPFMEYFFVLEVCTAQGCARSVDESVFTLEGVPSGQPPPRVNETTSTSIFLDWDGPSEPNGDNTSYSVYRQSPSLLSSPLLRDVGVAFDGNIIKQFSSSDNNLGGITNTITLSFRTFQPLGTILYYINEARTDYMAIELRNGVPWFFFDSGSGPAVIQPDLRSNNVQFNDGEWHSITTAQTGRMGNITVDGRYYGSGMSSGTDQVISNRQILYIGGIPDGIPRSTISGSQSSNSTLIGLNYAGCIFGVTLNNQPLDISTSTDIGDTINANIPGCSIELEYGTSFLGGGYITFPSNTLQNTRFSWTFDIRTTHNQGLIFFVYNMNQTGVAVEIKNSLLQLELISEGSIQRSIVINASVCDGEWHTILIDRSTDEFFLSLDGIGDFLILPSTDIIFPSAVFFGGVPMGTSAYDLALSSGVNVYSAFSGCSRPQADGLIVNGERVPLIPVDHYQVRFDGCHASQRLPSSTCVTPWVSFSAGTSRYFNDTSLQPFSEYLYRIQAENSAGFTSSGWIVTNTAESAPSGVGVVSLVSQTSTSFIVSWTRPTVPNGLITQYDITFTPVRTVGLNMPLGTSSTVPLLVDIPQKVLIATATRLQPATTFSVTLSASTRGGNDTGPTIELTTNESVPISVQAPMVVSVSSREITLSWNAPIIPNGIITTYNLYVNGSILFSGSGNITIISALLPFTEYTLLLEACTAIGCTNGTSIVGQTLPDAPSDLLPPVLTVLGPSSISAQWQNPGNPNGVIRRFELRRLATDSNMFEVVFNDTNLNLEMTITGLVPNTNYTFQLLAFNDGGSVSSPTVQVLTLEDIPDEISPPVIDVVDSTSLNVSWLPPAIPNGNVILYNLTLNGVVIFSSAQDLSYAVTGLQPFTSYSFTVIACTVQGCGSSNTSSGTTLEATPSGYIPPTISSISPYEITLIINPVMNPNGIVNYVLFITGDYRSSFTGQDLTGERAVFNDSMPSIAVITDLIPFTNYSLYLEVENSAGTLSSSPFFIQTTPTVPEDILAPSLSLINATTVFAEWMPPLRPNGFILSYQLTVSGGGSSVTTEHGLSTMATLTDLTPFTLYLVSVIVTNTEGMLVSAETNITTGETAPSGFDRIVLLSQGPRHIILSWDPPAMINGILINYTVVLEDIVIDDVPPFTQSYNVTGLSPFTSYNFSVMACTSVDCVDSPFLVARTLEDFPEGLSAPFVSSGIGQPVLILWTAPSAPNGIILQYQVERLDSDSNLVTIGTLQGMEPSLALVDTMATPFTMYSYRVIAENSAGSLSSNFTVFVTPEAAPEGIASPLLLVFSSSIIQVSFAPPLLPLGNITMYTVTRTTSSSPNTRIFSFTPATLPQVTSNGTYAFNDTNLLPFTNYSYVLRVCNGGGCSDSVPSVEFTLEGTPMGVTAPMALTINSTEILVEWVEPSMPNGVIQVYDVFRLSLGFDRNSTRSEINCCEEYVENRVPEECTQVTTTMAEEFLDINLYPFSFYRYCIIATNNAESAFSALTPLTRTSPAAMPLVGPTLNATTINSTAIFLEWGVLGISDLLGPLDGYTLYIQVSEAPGPRELLFQGNDQSFTATGLLASTEYIFIVEVSNGVGSTQSDSISAITDEGIPFGLPDPEVEAVRSDALSVLVLEPLQPNGFIILYNVLLGSNHVMNLTIPGTILLEGLTPYTFYTVQIEACTQFGCTQSSLVGVRTLESIPEGLGSPFVTATGPRSVEVSWSPPNQPNGNITEYNILQHQVPTTGSPIVVFSGLALEVDIIDLRPFTTYSFQVSAMNGAGNVTSLQTTVTTFQAPPSRPDPPSVIVLSSMTIIVSWAPPSELNGELLGYQVYRNGTGLLPGLTDLLNFSEQDLMPFTQYEYFIEVCGGGGCANSTSVSNTTFEALPEMVLEPVISNVTPRFLVLTWEEPSSPNGIIIEYILTLLNMNMVVFRGIGFMATLPGLSPFTEYSFNLMACNSIGCVTSNQTDVQTLETNPEGLDSPRLRNLTSTSVAIEWMAPVFPNGNITTYILRRGNDSFSNVSRIIFQGFAFSFNDVDLAADTLYFYTVEAVNGGGSVISLPVYHRTVEDLAELIQPPTVNVQGPREIVISWSAPGRPNGDISSYRLFINNIEVFTGLQFEYTASELTPFTRYSFFVEVCNQAGCASSITVSAVTSEAPVEGVTPPLLTVVGPTIVNVSWVPPTQPNGVITQYQIRRRLLNQLITETLQYIGPDNILSFPNSGLSPFTFYEYRLRVTNGAGSTFSEWVSVQTTETIPEGLSLPLFDASDIFARNITATWMAPTTPNGIILRYILEYRLAIDPITFGPGSFMTAEEVPANVTTATASGLSPVTVYEFRVITINGAGNGVGPLEDVSTQEDIPEDIQPIIVEQRTGDSLVLTWNPPLTPNGIIREYVLLLDGESVYRDSALTYTVSRLQPFTSYGLQLAACTSAGCTFGDIQSATTAETTPFGQGSPTLSVLGSGSVSISWNLPVQPNGIIIRYEVIRQVNFEPSSMAVVFSTDNILNRTYIDSNVRSAQSYQYAVRATNSIGTTESNFSSISTPESAPIGLTAAILTTISASMIQVSWLPPTQPNGVITMYQAFRTGGGAVDMSVFSSASNRGFTEQNLMPFTQYTYVIQACTAVGCSLSPPNTTTTREAIPTGFLSPQLRAITESSVSIEWVEPARPNGVITLYNITVLPIQINVMVRDNTEFSRNISNLRPFTSYMVTLSACNSVGCVTSNSSIRTLQSTPEFISPPQVHAVNSTALAISWMEPTIPNGIIVLYELRRNGTLIFNGTDMMFIDDGLTPNQNYSYSIQAYTSVGAGRESNVSVIQTPPDTPMGVIPPFLTSSSSSSILATWTEPSRPNGVIQRYILVLDGQNVFDGIGFEFTAFSLVPFSSHTFQLVVCTTTCASSAIVNASTLEAPPVGQEPPILRENDERFIEVTWNPTQNPNGVITRYELERRELASPSTVFQLVFNGSALTFIDRDPVLRPTMTYGYRISVFNSVGKNTSDTRSIMLSEAPPEEVPLPIIQNITATSIVILATPPVIPNGVIRTYRLYQNGTRVQEIIVPEDEFIVMGLNVFTLYVFSIEACTQPGCTISGQVMIRTGETTPSILSPPVGVVQSPREIQIRWTPPQQPNGIILSYSLWYRKSCPQPPQPNLIPSPICNVGPLTLISNNIPSNQLSFVIVGSNSNDPLPYSSYQFQVSATNSEGSVNSTTSESAVTTLPSAPEVIRPVELEQVFRDGGTTISLNWLQTFRLNDVLIHFSLLRNGVLLTQNPATSVMLPQEPVRTTLEYVIIAVTESGQMSATIETRIEDIDPSTTSTMAQTTLQQTDLEPQPTDIPFYQEAPFIVGMVVLGVAILFIFLLVFFWCVRPRGDKKGLHISRSFQPDNLLGRSPYSKVNQPSPDRHVTRSWSPKDVNMKGEIPYTIEQSDQVFTPILNKSYSPTSKMESMQLNEHGHRLSDIVISNSPSPQQLISAKEDFGSYKRQYKHQQTTFEDTKV